MHKRYEPIATAQLDWNTGGLPVSREYGDVYFSDEGGLAESRHVFLSGNGLPQRLVLARRFTVGETGFGSGLNFLALWRLWERVAPEGARLHFFSAEKHPLRREDMARIHALFPELEPNAAALRDALPLPVPGFHRLLLADGRVTLTLMYGDALTMFREQEAQADAWFLDGFAPRLNPRLWTVELAEELRRLSAPGATVATFSTSQGTMDALSAAGFAAEKTPGFGRKKHMLSGKAAGEWRPAGDNAPPHVRVVGGGLAGASAAYALARRGIPVILHEKERALASGTSANPCAVFYPGVGLGWSPETCFYFTGFSFSRRLLQEVARTQALAHDFCGMLLFPKPSDAPGRMARVVAAMQPQEEVFHRVGSAEASSLAGISLRQEALHFPGGGWVSIRDYARALASHPHITLSTQSAEPASAGPVVLCHGWQASDWFPEAADYIHPVMGQITQVQAVPGGMMEGLRCVLSYGGYIAPTGQGGTCHLGATYERGYGLPEADGQKGAQDNIGKLSAFLGQPAGVLPTGSGWAGLRPVSRDRMPMVGLWREGIHLSMAHASRGLLSCGIGGEYIASLLLGEPMPLPRTLTGMLNPHRFSTQD